MRLLSVRETADRCRVSPFTVRRWVRVGKLPATKPGRNILIPESAVTEYLSAGQVSEQSPVDEYIESLVDSAPELTPEQVSKLRQILAR